MTISEAEKFLGLSKNWEIDDLLDSKDEILFELKNFFLIKPPIKKMFHSRLIKLVQLHEALFLLGYQSSDIFKPHKLNFTSSENLLTTFQNYNKEKLALKSKISNSENALEINNFALTLIDLEKKYAVNWFHENCWNDETLVSKEIDSMYILNSIKQYDSNEGKTFEDLKNNKNNPPEILISEMKRLSLLFEKY